MVCRIAYQPASDEDYCPPNLYGESKARGEVLVRGAGLDCEWVIFRPCSIWGPWFEIPYRTFFLSIARGRYFRPGDHDPRKSFGYVGNTIYQIDRLLHAPREQINRRTIYVCDYPPLRLSEWANMIAKALGSAPIRTLPYPVLKIGAAAGDLLKKCGWQEPPLTSFRLNNLITDMVYDSSPLEEICGDLPYSLETGVADTVAWLRNRGHVS